MKKNKYEIVKFIDDNIELDVNIDPYSETIWLTQSQMEELFAVKHATISEHLIIFLKKKNLMKKLLSEFPTKAQVVENQKYII